MNQNNRKNTNEKDQTGDIMSWVIIFILMFALPPLGLILLVLKMRSYAKPGKSSESSTKNSSSSNSQTASSSKTYNSYGASSNRQNSNSSDTAQWAVNQAKDVAEQAGAVAQQAIYKASAAAQSAIKEAQDVIKEATGGTWEDFLGSDDSKKTTNTSQHTDYNTSNADRDTIIRASGPARQNTTQWQTTTNSSPAKGATANNQFSAKSGKTLSVTLLVISIAMFFLSFILLLVGIEEAQTTSPWFAFSMAGFFLTGGVTSLISRSTIRKKLFRYQHYYAYIAEKSVVPISSIAQSAGRSARAVRRDIQNMINEGYFDAGTYIDKELDSLILCGDAAEEIRRSAMSFDDTPQTAGDMANQYMSILAELRELGRSVADITISGKIDKIEELAAKIFRIVEEQPEKKNQIRRFESYYLPTTMKLIRSYSTLEKQGVKGENIMATKENIGRILDTLATGYEQQLDQLFKSDALDIATDINVIENLMQQDGLANDKADFKTMTG